MYAYTFRSRAERVLWTLRECDFSYEVKRLDPFKGETSTSEFIHLNPSRKIPVLVHGEDILTESLAIMEYLNDISKSHNLIPRSPKKMFHFRRIIHYGLTELEPYLWVAEQASRLRALYSWPEGTYEAAMALLKKNINMVWQWVDTANHITGEEFTLADIYYYHLITWAKQHSVEYPGGVERYLKQLQTREAFPEEMLSNSNLPVKP